MQKTPRIPAERKATILLMGWRKKMRPMKKESSDACRSSGDPSTIAATLEFSMPSKRYA